MKRQTFYFFKFKIYWTINMFENEVRIENLRMNKNVYLWDFEMVKILAQAGLFHALVDNGCTCLDLNPVKCKPIPYFSFFFLLVLCVGDTRPRLIKFDIDKWSLGLNILTTSNRRKKWLNGLYSGAQHYMCCLW